MFLRQLAILPLSSTAIVPLTGMTAGSVLFIESDLSLGQDNANFFWDATNKYLGLGTAVPAATLDIEQPVITATTAVPALQVVGGNHTALTASAEYSAIYVDPGSVQFATGAQPIMRAVIIDPPTYAFVGASVIASAATLAINGAPVAGTNATLTNSFSLWVQSGNSRFQRDNLTTTTLPGLSLVNTTPAVISPGATVQVSPSLLWRGHAWASTAGVDRTLDWQLSATPITGLTATSTWDVQFRQDAAAFATMLSLSNVGSLTANGNYTTTGGFISAGGSDLALTLRGNKAAGTASTADVQIRSLATRTAGSILYVQNNTTTLLDVGHAGQLTQTVQAYSGNPNTGGAYPANGGTLSGSSIAGVFTDNVTAGSGTAASWIGHSIQGPATIAALNANVTTTNAALLFLGQAPASGTNNTISNPYSLWVVGKTRLDNQLVAAVGTVTAPSYTFIGDTDTGLYWSAINTIGLTTAGAVKMTIGPSGEVLHTPAALSGAPSTTGSYSNVATATFTDNGAATTFSGTGDAIAGGPTTWTLTDAGATFRSTDIGGYLVLGANWAAGNQGTWVISGYTSPSVISFTNPTATATAEPSVPTGVWTIQPPLFAAHAFQAPTLSCATAVTTRYAATVYISGAPIAAGSETISNPTGLLIERNNLAATTSPGIILSNSTDSTAGATVQASPSMLFHSSGWDTTAPALGNHYNDWQLFITPVSGANAFSSFYMQTRTDSAVFGNAFILSASSVLNINGITALGANTSFVLKGNKTLDVASTADVQIQSNVARTAGSILYVQNSTTTLLDMTYAGQLLRTPQALGTTHGAANTVGQWSNIAASTHTLADGAGTLATWYGHAWQAPTITGAAGTTIITDVATAFIAAPVITTITATRTYGLWNAGNTYLAAGLRAAVRTIATSPVTVTVNDFTINCTGSAVGTDVAQTVNLTITAAAFGSGRILIIKDGGGDAISHNITVNTAGGDTIDRAASPRVINVNSTALWLMSDGVSDWLIV